MITILQIIAAIIIGVCLYMLAVVMTMYDGLITMVFGPIMGLIFTTIAVVGLLIVGLPLRIKGPVHRWWIAHWWIPLLLGVIAFVMVCASGLPALRVQVYDDIQERMIESFHPMLGIVGWLLALFNVLHFYPPFFLLQRPKKTA